MNGRILDDNNDVFLDPVTHSVRRASSLAEKVKRSIETLLRTFEGECFVDYSAGVPWFDEVLGNSVLFADEISGELKDKIRSVEGVESVETIRVKVEGRNVSGIYRVRLVNGQTVSDNF